jgi:hypothetical protein
VAVTGSVLHKFYNLSISPRDKALCELFIGAFFFAMRSCEYIKVQGPRKTKLLVVKNVRFFKGNRQLAHSDPALPFADCVSITFEQQKRDTKNDIITQHQSGDKLLCPVRIWASIVQRILSYPGANSADTVNKFRLSDASFVLFTGTELLKKLRLAATAVGPDTLGFTAKEIGLHSARSGAAMAMYLAHIPVFTIMLLGHWSSDAFLRCIRKQVKKFSNVVSSKMIAKESFFTIPSASSEIPCIPDHHLNLAFRNKNGLGFKSTIKPLASVFH